MQASAILCVPLRTSQEDSYVPDSDYVLTKQKIALKKPPSEEGASGKTAAPKQMVLERPDARGWDLVSTQPEPSTGKELLVVWKLRT